MRILLIHLSDIHIKDATDGILQRAESIGRAAWSRNDGSNLVVCLVSGDIAFSGGQAQYELAYDFLRLLVDAIPVPVQFVLLPGNHDLDFTRSDEVRELLIKSILENPENSTPEAFIRSCIAPQEAFFEFRDRLSDSRCLTGENRLQYDYKFSIDSESVFFRCVNTAWLSSINEKPGTLVMPGLLKSKADNGGFTITTFHHPPNWLIAASQDKMRQIEASSDLILTGHEHTHERYVKHNPEKLLYSTYIAAAALQPHGHDVGSAFNVIMIDVEKREYKFFHFEWDGDLYSSKNLIGDWEALPTSAGRSKRVLEFSPGFLSWLNDPGIPGASVSRNGRSLFDFYLYPDLLEPLRDPALTRSRRITKGPQVLAELTGQETVFIHGVPKSGRTSLAKRLLSDLATPGCTPLYLDALTNNLRADQDITSMIARQVEIQYGEDRLEQYIQLSRESRIVIIDNAERVKGRKLDRIKVAEKMSDFASLVIFLGDNSTGQLTELGSAVSETWQASSAAYDIQPFNYYLRERLAQRWFVHYDMDELESSNRLEYARQALDTIIGRNYVPAFPIHLIAVLQAIEDGQTVDYKASTHGYFYDLLIRQALTTGSETKDVGTRMSFLTHLGHEMHMSKNYEILQSDLRKSFQNYIRTYAIGALDETRFIAALVERGILIRDADIFRFRYPYLLNYFVATYLSKHITTEVVRSEIKDLASSLDDDHSADILMFLAHLSHDSFVVESLLAAADACLADYVLETFQNPADVEQTEIQLEYAEPLSQNEARQLVAQRNDAQNVEHAAKPIVEQDNADASVFLRDAVTAIHTVRVLGQIVKNFHGELIGETKVQLVRASYKLALRLLNLILGKIQLGREELLQSVEDIIRRNSPSVAVEQVKRMSQNYLWTFSIIISYGVLRALIESLAAKELALIYDEVFAKGEAVAEQLIYLGLQIDVSRPFPKGAVIQAIDTLKKDPLPKVLLKLFVLTHFDRIYVPPSDRQSVCTKLSIPYRPLSALRI